MTPTSRQVDGRQEKDAKVGKSNDVMPVIIVGNCSELPVSWPDVLAFTVLSAQKALTLCISRSFRTDSSPINFTCHRCTTIPQLFYHHLTNRNTFNSHVIGRVQLRAHGAVADLGGNKMASGMEVEMSFEVWRRIGNNFDVLLNDMGLELKLHSPAGAEPLVYSWPLLKSVSFSRPVFRYEFVFCSQDGKASVLSVICPWQSARLFVF